MNAVFSMSTLWGMNGGRRRLVVVSVVGCGDRHCILPQMSLLGGGVRCSFLQCILWAGGCVPAVCHIWAGDCGPVVCSTGRQLCFTGRRLSACHRFASFNLGVWEIVITWILICSQWAHGCGVTSLKMFAGAIHISASVIGN